MATNIKKNRAANEADSEAQCSTRQLSNSYTNTDSEIEQDLRSRGTASAEVDGEPEPADNLRHPVAEKKEETL